MSIAQRYPTITQAALQVIARKGYHQASIRQIASAAGLSLAGLYHYVGSKDELLFLVLDQALDTLLAKLDAALAEAVTPEARLLALIRTHLEFAFNHGAALKVINRDVEALADHHRVTATRKRQSYLLRGLEILRALDGDKRSHDELLAATNLLLGMLNGIATRPFVGQERGVEAVTAEVGRLFLHGFLGSGKPTDVAAVPGEPCAVAPGPGSDTGRGRREEGAHAG